jgi:hypothetical protein
MARAENVTSAKVSRPSTFLSLISLGGVWMTPLAAPLIAQLRPEFEVTLLSIAAACT